jgi:hypothetical protein
MCEETKYFCGRGLVITRRTRWAERIARMVEISYKYITISGTLDGPDC